MLGIESCWVKTRKLYSWLGEACVRVVPADDFDDRVAPQPIAEDVANNRLIEVSALPPGAIGVADFDLKAGDDAALEVEVKPIGLGKADVLAAAGAVDEPT